MTAEGFGGFGFAWWDGMGWRERCEKRMPTLATLVGMMLLFMTGSNEKGQFLFRIAREAMRSLVAFAGDRIPALKFVRGP